MIGVSGMGMLSSRLNKVHMLDSFFDYSTYKVVVHTSSVQQEIIGSVEFVFRLASRGVWISMLTILLAAVLFQALSFYLPLNTPTGHSESIADSTFRLLATTISQGLVLLMFHSAPCD